MLPIVDRSNEYAQFFKFIEKYKGQEFNGIDLNDPFILELERMMEKNNQFFYLADFTRLKIIFCSKRSKQLMGLEPNKIDNRGVFERTHPDDVQRHGVSRSKMFQLTNDIYSNPNEDYVVASTNYRFLNHQEVYKNILIQGYFFKCKNPELNMYGILVHTDISWFGKNKHGFNLYVGKDISNFRFPDKEVIMKGCIFTNREFEILKLIKCGMSSEGIAKQLFISSFTVDTHRKNILKKTDKTNTAELIFELQEKGFF